MLVSRNYLLALVATFSLVLKALDPVFSPVIGGLDPWFWVLVARDFLATGHISQWFVDTGYPPVYMYVIACITSFGIDAYNVIRYVPIVSSLCVIPFYLLTLEIFNSRKIAAMTSLLTVTSRWFFSRTSMGIPEGLSHIVLGFTLFYLLRSLKTGRWIYRASAAILMILTTLLYHFTLAILTAFLILLPFLVRFKGWRKDVRTLGSIAVPAFLFSGSVWYFRVVGSFINTYAIATHHTYDASSIGIPMANLLQTLAYSIGKLGTAALSTLGYTAVGLAVFSLVELFFWRKTRESITTEVRFLFTYLVALALLAFGFGLLYNITGMAGTGATRLYIFGWLTMPVAAFASKGIAMMSEALRRTLTHASRVFLGMRLSRAIPVVVTIVVCLINLSAINYYKAWSGQGLGILQSHYAVKYMTDQEYYALDYVRLNTPGDSIVLTVGIEDTTILTQHATVCRRAIVSIRNFVDDGKMIMANVRIVHPDMSQAVGQSRMIFDSKDGGHIYLIRGIKKMSVELAEKGGSPAPETVLMEELLMDRITRSKGYERVYYNDQVAVLRLTYTTISYGNA